MAVMCDQLRTFGSCGVLLGIKIDEYCAVEFCSPLGFSTILKKIDSSASVGGKNVPLNLASGVHS
jgi:hypothetical protein